jgi:hypothetical protein
MARIGLARATCPGNRARPSWFETREDALLT